MQPPQSLCSDNNIVPSNQEKLDYWKQLSTDYSLIPLRENSKIPVENNWSAWSESKREFKEEDFKHVDSNGIEHINNAGVACGRASKILVLDIDDVVLFNEYCKEHGLLDDLSGTYTVETGRGGYHLYFRYPDDGHAYGNKSIKQGKFDIRGLGGQVVAPGSIHPETGKVYKVLTDAPLAPAPEWIKSLSRKKVEVEIPDMIKTLPISAKIMELIMTDIQVGQRSEAVMKVLNALVSANVPNETIFAIFDTYPIGEKHRERGDSRFDQLEVEIENARAHLLTPAPVQTVSNNKYDSIGLWTLTDMMAQEGEMDFIVEGMWPKGQTLLVIGSANIGKSAFTLNLALEFAAKTNNKFLGKFQVVGDHTSLFIQSENSWKGYKQRSNSISTAMGYPLDTFDKLNFPNNNNDPRVDGKFSDNDFRDFVKRLVGESGSDILIIDPLISFHLCDENDNGSMRRALDTISKLSQELNVSTMIPHHAGKGIHNMKSPGGRGASSIGDWAENSISLSEKIVGSKRLIEMNHTKARDMERFLPVMLDLGSDMVFRNADNVFKSKDEQNIDVVVNALESLGGKANKQKSLIDAVTSEYANQFNDTISINPVRKLIADAVSSGVIQESIDGKNKCYEIVSTEPHISCSNNFDFDTLPE